VHVLIATDGSPTAVNAARHAQALAPRRVTLLTVLTSLPGEDIDEFDEPGSTLEEQARQWEVEIREANRELTRTGAVVSTPHVERRIEAGDVAPTVVRVARELGVDVVVLGADERRRRRRRWRRSVAECVVRDAPCSVFVVRPPAH
jgi:nucleotide-binding universal stress UspA family protein